MRTLANLVVLTMVFSGGTVFAADPGVIVFHESAFPAADTAPAPDSLLEQALPGAQFVSAGELKERLNSANLLVLAYGSAFPEEAWPAIQSFLERGGNLLVLGGRPFSRAAYRDQEDWKLRDYGVRYTRVLGIDQYQETPGSDGLTFEANPDIPLGIPAFTWKQGFSPIIHLSAVDLYNREGSAGLLDSNLDALAWGTKGDRRMSAPVIQIDHFRNRFDGGRWIFIDARLPTDFYATANAREMIAKLAEQAANGAEEFTARPVMPLYLPGEPVEVAVTWKATRTKHKAALAIDSDWGGGYAGVGPLDEATSSVVKLDPPKDKGLHTITARLEVDGRPYRSYHSAFWIRDLDYLRSGPKLTVNENYFEVDGKPLAVLGTTYMSSEVQRLYFDHPNVYVWDRDLRQIHRAGLNMIRTGWWTGWDKFSDEDGVPYERTLRTLEAYLMTARRYGLPVQFTFFAFLPEVLGGVNPYLDPEALRKQKTLIRGVAARFHDVPFLAYDLINEPSFSRHLWTMRPNGDPIETEKWNEWLNRHYPSRPLLAAAWNVPITSLQGAIPLPEELDFQPRGMYEGHNSLKIYDYEMFAQDGFADWVKAMRDAIRQTGSGQLVTVGQDEGGFQDRLSPAFFGRYVDFTTNHSWWQNDSILWDSLVAKQPGKAMLIQETGLQRELNLDETSRRTPENEAALFERKLAMAFVHGAGAIEWLWNTNSYMTEGNETPIGALRADGTEKPEATVMRNFARFAAELSPHLRNPEPAQVAILASQAAQYSAIADLQIEAQRKAARVLAYYTRLTPYLIYENQIDKLGNPKLVIVPSAQALTEAAWQQLLKYAEAGGNLLITGPVDRDEHGQVVNRAAQLLPGAYTVPVTYHNSDSTPPDDSKSLESFKLSFDSEAQGWLESLRIHPGPIEEVSHGQGAIFWTSDPIELAQGDEPAGKIYAYVLARANHRAHMDLRPQFQQQSDLSPGVMVYPLALADSVLYIFVSDSAQDEELRIQDQLTGVPIALRLPAEHAALALIGRREKAIIAKYGF
jgi:Beta-galactosidase